MARSIPLASMSRIGVVSLASLTLVAGISLYESVREATPRRRPPIEKSSSISSNDTSVAGERRNPQIPSDPRASEPDFKHYANLFLAFAAGGAAANRTPDSTPFA